MATNSETVYNDLVHLGLPAGAAAGVVGNLYAESGLNPTITGDHGTSFGIAQWHNARWTALKRYAANLRGGLGTGADYRLLSTQEGFLVYELKQMGLWDRLKRITSPDAAAALVMREYERPASTDPSARQAYAREAFANGGRISGSADTSKAGGGVVPGPGAIVQGATDAIGGAITAAADKVLGAVGPIVVKGGFVVLGLALVGVGVTRAASGTR